LSNTPINVIIERINELARKQKTNEGLEEWERAEQESLRQEYLKFIRGQIQDTLKNVKITDKNPLQ
jgi:Uncharacterized protein conserved in bacteria